MSGNINEQSPGGAEQGAATAENFLGALGKVRRDMVAANDRKEDSDDELQLGGGKRRSALSLLSGKKKGSHTTLASEGGDEDDVDGAKVAPEQRRAVLDARIAEEGRQRMDKMKLSTSKRIDERSKSTEEDGTDKMVPALEDGGEEAVVSQIPGISNKPGDHLGTNNKTSPEDASPEDASPGPSGSNPRGTQKRQGSIMGAMFGTSTAASKKLSSSSSHGSEKTSSSSFTKQLGGSSTVSQLFARTGTTDTVAKKRMGMFGIRQGTTMLENDALFAAAEKEANEKVEERRFYLGRKLKAVRGKKAIV
eukprot:g3644.t1